MANSFHLLRLTAGFVGVKLMACAGLLGAESDSYSIRAWQTAEGLPHDSVTSIAQTPDKYLWLATFNGLARFDGVRFVVFDDGNTPVLQSSRLTRLDVDGDGRLWIITEDGALTSLQGGRFNGFTAREGLPAAGAAAVIQGPQGSTLLLDREGGVCRFVGNRWLRDQSWPSLKSGPVSLFTTDTDQLWVWSRQKRTLGRLVGNQVSLLQRPDGLREAEVRAFARSREGGLWLVLSNRVWHYNCRHQEWRRTAWSLPDSVHGLTCTLEDSCGNLWISTFGHGVLRFDPSGNCEQFTTSEGLSHDVVRALWEDHEGSVWAGTDGGGLNRFKPRLVTVYGRRHGLPSEVVMSAAADRQDPEALWLGLNGGGVSRLRLGQSTPLMAEPMLNTNTFVYSVYASLRGDLWIGSYDAGLLRFHDGAVSTAAELGGGEWAGKPLLASLEAPDGSVWLGGRAGLWRWESGRLTNCNAEIGSPVVTASALALDHSGNLYVATSGRGFYRFSDRHWTRYAETDGLADNHISSLYIDPEDAVWIGTLNGGLSLFKRGRFTNLTTREGLPGDCIASIVADDHNNLWLGSNRGIFRIPKEQVTEIAAGRRRTVSGSTYGAGEGLSTLQCGAVCKTVNGKLWFATAKGLAAVDPGKLSVNTLPPPVLLEEVLLDNQQLDHAQATAASLAAGGGTRRATSEIEPAFPPAGTLGTVAASSEVTIAPRHGRLEFRFTALSFLSPDKVRFRYRLEGFDTEWIDGGSQRSAYYTRLPAGNYRFRVTACNNDGVWNETGAALNLRVLPFWWMTWWARSFAFALIAGLALWVVEARLHRVKREHALQRALSRRLIEAQEEERKRIAAGLHDSLGQDLLVIKNRALLGLKHTDTPARAAEQFSEISRMASTSLAEVREISHDLRPYQLDRLGLTKAIQAMVTGVSAASGLRCVARIEPLDGRLAAPMEIHCYRILQELLNNVVKHSHASEARVGAACQDHKILLAVSDDGCGFDAGAAREAGRGSGLTDIAERVRILGGRLHCDSARASGTRWTIEIPLPGGCSE